MRWTVLASAVVAVAALAVALALFAVEQDRDRCTEASSAAFNASRGPIPALERAADRVIADCSGSEPLTRISVGLLVLDRAGPALKLARAAARREPGNYAAWAVLAAAAPPQEARAAGVRANSLNPLAARDDGP